MPQKSWKNKQTTDLLKTILQLKTQKEAEAFFRDLLTLKEIDEAARRWQVVLLLEKGLPYREIAEKTGHSTTTVARISYWLQHGEGGYRLMLKRMGKCK
jgi:TrpR-related protein YerC/YecD